MLRCLALLAAACAALAQQTQPAASYTTCAACVATGIYGWCLDSSSCTSLANAITGCSNSALALASCSLDGSSSGGGGGGGSPGGSDGGGGGGSPPAPQLTVLPSTTCGACTLTPANAWCGDVGKCYSVADAQAALGASSGCTPACTASTNPGAPQLGVAGTCALPPSCSGGSSSSSGSLACTVCLGSSKAWCFDRGGACVPTTTAILTCADSALHPAACSGSRGGSGGGGAGDFLAAAIVAAALDPAQAALTTASIATNAACATGGALVFLGLLFWCTRASCTANCACCCAIGKRQSVGAWKASAPLALGRALGAAYLLLQGLALLGAALAMPWATFSAAFTLPAFGVGGALACAATAQCSGGTLMSAGAAVLYAALVLAVPAWVVAWVAAVRLRNVAFQASLPDSACCGSLPAATYLAATAALLALAGTVTAWVGYSAVMALVPAGAVKAGPPPGGIAVVLGLACLLAGCAMLCLSTAALAGAPVPLLSGAWPLACSTASTTSSGAGKSKGPMKLAVAVVQATPDGPKVVLSRVVVGGGRATGTPKGKGAHVALEVTKPRAITNK